MDQLVTIKSYPKGLTLVIKEDADILDVYQEITEKFFESKSFFGKMKVALAFEGKNLTDEEVGQIVDIVRTRSDLQVVCTVGRDLSIKNAFEKALSEPEQEEEKPDLLTLVEDSEDALVIARSLKDMEEIDSDRTVVVYGDVPHTASIYSDKDIIILGKAGGNVCAGLDDLPHFIYAKEFACSKIKIGDLTLYDQKSGSGLFGKKGPMVAKLSDHGIEIKPY
ncbi:MAG: hypothetical protein K6E48_00290 [Lachnospiraceae bacterium]|nr:hypothetical protein [Lachnospiraceae bacterium]